MAHYLNTKRMATYRDAKSVKAVIQRYFSEYLISHGSVGLLDTQEWHNIVGETIAAYSRPLYIENNILVIGTSYPAWNHMILLNSNRIVSAVNALGRNLFINSIKVKLTHKKKM